jgi:hypothetical protein
VALAIVSICLAASAADTSEEAAGLISDLARIVDTQETVGWFLDSEALESIRETVMESICRTSPEARGYALAELERRKARFGDARALYERSGRVMTRDVKNALSLERQHRALEMGLERAHDCPFWVEADGYFQGRQTDRNRFTLSVETGGNAQIRQTEGTWTLGGGGLGRLLPGYGFGGDYSLLIGVEFGGGAMLRPRTTPTEFVINYFPALPVVFRIHDVAWHYDIEAGPVALFQADDGSFSFGVRGGFATGVAALRTRGVIPWGGAALAYEHYFPSGGRARAHFIRGGLRVGIVWDP